jgi:hypothetical protein
MFIDHQFTTVDAGHASEPAIGAHLVTLRSGYEHHGIYAGNGRVVHYAGFARLLRHGPIEEISIEEFAAGRAVSVRTNSRARFEGEEVVLRARARLGENRYRLLTNNCEHFCAWCVFGENRSRQVEACLTHPRVALQTAMGMVKELLEGGRTNAPADLGMV